MNFYVLSNLPESEKFDSEKSIYSLKSGNNDYDFFNEHNNFDDRSTGQFSENENNAFTNNVYYTSNSKKEEEKNEKKFIGKKRKNDKTKGKHNKYTYDNSMNKGKRLILTNVLNDINKKIIEVYKGDIGYGMAIKKLLMINQKQIVNSNINFNKKFLNKTIGDIFSVDITKRHTNFSSDKNKKTIEELKNEKDLEKKEYFNGLFNTTFLECLNNFIGKTVNNKYIKGFKTFNELKNEPEFTKKVKDKKYIGHLEKYLWEYEYNLNQKKGRKERIKKNKEKI